MVNPWFKFYGGDFLLDPDVDAMPREAEALLIRMWCVCHREGSCPADVESLARKTLCGVDYVSRYKPHCDRFFELRDGRLYSRRMDHEKQRSEQARKNANARFKNKPDSKSESKSKSETDTESESERGSAVCSAISSANGSANSTPTDLHPLNYGAKICDELGLPQERTNLHAFASAIEALVKKGKSLAAAFEFLLARAKDAQQSGELAHPVFWCRDGSYNLPAGQPRYRPRPSEGISGDWPPEADAAICKTCSGLKQLHLQPHVPTPLPAPGKNPSRLIPCPDCFGEAANPQGEADNSSFRKPAQDVSQNDSYIDGRQSV